MDTSLHRTLRTAATSTAAIGLVLGLGACGSTDHSDPAAAPASPSSSSSSGPSSSPATATGGASVSAEHNATDTMFNQMMIVHHQGALEMAALAPSRASDPQVRALAARIRKAQQPEIDEMTRWLAAWGEPTSAGHGGMDHMGMGGDHGMGAGMTMGGRSQAEVNATLKRLTGKDFDRAFLTDMIAHHEGAVTMSQMEVEQGSNPQTTALAKDIITAQRKEIALMRTLLRQA